jgi:hypothetical protein
MTALSPLVPDRLLLVYDGNSGLGAMLLDVVKKAVGKEECPLCEIVYSPLGKRASWRTCEASLGLPIEEWHRDRVPTAWNLAPEALPCILGRTGDSLPFVLVTREQIVASNRSADALETVIRDALSARQVGGLGGSNE